MVKFTRGQLVSTNLKWWERLRPLPAYDGTWCFPPTKVYVLGYRDDMVAWETIAETGRVWYFTDEKLR